MSRTGTLKAIGRTFMAAEGWCWVEGMAAVVHESTWRITSVDAAIGRPECFADSAGWRVSVTDVDFAQGNVDIHHPVPDLGDDATRAIILYLFGDRGPALPPQDSHGNALIVGDTVKVWGTENGRDFGRLVSYTSKSATIAMHNGRTVAVDLERGRMVNTPHTHYGTVVGVGLHHGS